jgi:hypothetical protein
LDEGELGEVGGNRGNRLLERGLDIGLRLMELLEDGKSVCGWRRGRLYWREMVG